jgi:hemolysin activation/secretion protein
LLDYEFYQANTLGGLSNLRGFRRSRFSGRSSFYHNLEARLKLLSFKSYLFPAHLGVLAFNDLGRVWNPNETSQKWHHGYGGGIWLSPFQMAVVTLTYGRSSEDEVISFKLGFSSSNIFYNHYKIISKNKLFWS